MVNIWLVARQEYRRIAVKRSFLLVTLAIPLGLAALIGMAAWVELSGTSSLPIGYVDDLGFLDAAQQTELPDAQERIQVRSFTSALAAQAALEAGQIQAFFVFPSNYRETLSTDLYYLEDPPGSDAWREFDDFVRINLIASYPDEVKNRLFEGPLITVHDITNQREFSEQGIINIILPFLVSFLFVFATMFAAGYMLQAVTDEKENRMMEILLTSLTPNQLISGKTAGLFAVAVTQLAIYIASIVIGLLIAQPYVAFLQHFKIPWNYIGIMAMFFIPSYALFAAIMVVVGSAVSELEQGQQFAGFLNLLFLLPLFLLPILFNDPSSPLMVLLTFFPPTAFLTISLRWGLSSIPVWQMALSWILLVSTTIFLVWLAARVFRIGMLHYGQPLKWQTILAALRAA